MKKIACIVLAIMMLLTGAVSSHAERHGGGGRGPGWWPVIGLGLGVGMWELSRPYYYPYGHYYYDPPVIIQQQPSEVYIQQAPEAAPQPVQEPVYWYYCPDPQGYYPYVKQCPKGWMRVIPTPPAPQ